MQKARIQINWTYCQNNSDIILFEAITKLTNSISCNWNEINITDPGNYLIIENDKYYYIGEAKNLKKRLKQQFTPSSSTFYKNYLKVINENSNINDFEVKAFKTNIGRKEVEEFGIVNLPAILNKFQLGKRNKVSFNKVKSIWEEIQDKKEELLTQGEEEFFKQPIINWFDASVPSSAGVYAVFDNSQDLIYIGESSDINKRHITHSGGTYFSALRRHIGTDILGFELIDSNTKKKRKFIEENDILVTDFLKRCRIRYAHVSFGRYELEEYLIKKHNPVLNRKDKKNSK